ncbi:MAG: Gfo/Idh/MocA family oxidoreductase [SAR202 cluster bacterium]|nr:Gfo/Idh/MocA family oxidoreductase [SAR202 cluster bacterium]
MAEAKKAKYRVGMIGGGRKGTQHARAYELNPRSEVVAIADTDPENLELFKQRFKLNTGYSDYREMLEKENLDIVAPILPVGPNPDVVIGCARSGKVKAIFCEKPMAISLEQADTMVEECRKRGIKFASGDAYRSFQ